MLRVTNLNKCNSELSDANIILDDYILEGYENIPDPYLLQVHYKNGKSYQNWYPSIESAKRDFNKIFIKGIKPKWKEN